MVLGIYSKKFSLDLVAQVNNSILSKSKIIMLILSSIYLSNYYYHYVKFNKFSRKEYSTHPSPDALLIASSLLHEQMKPFH